MTTFSDRPQSAFRRTANVQAIRWKQSTSLLPDEARLPARYSGRYGSDHPSMLCLPVEYAALNLLPEARAALGWFAEADVRWHDGVNGGPSNHLLDSQVQCVNALAPMASSPQLLLAAFGDVLPMAAVLPMPSGRFLEFEWIGDEDYLGEGRGAARVRGSMVTSADAAFRYLNVEGDVELALLEWKYTEDYRGHELSVPRGAPRPDRYRSLWDDPGCPVSRDVLPYEDLFVEPFYQLFRQQLLAWRMTVRHECEATHARVVHVVPATSDGYRLSLNRDSQRAAGDDVLAVWRRLLREQADFVAVKFRATSPPPFEVADGVRCVPAGDLSDVRETPDRYVIVGAGKTALDACAHLLERGVPPDRICWIKPREGDGSTADSSSR